MSEWKWVPVEPTPEMEVKGGHACSEWLNDKAPIGESAYRAPAVSIYKDMLAAAPTAEPAQVQREWRPEVIAFADAMERKLRDNDHKPGWKNDNHWALMDRVAEELAELRTALYAKTYRDAEDYRRNVLDEAVDVANMLMMVVDVIGALLPRPCQHHEAKVKYLGDLVDEFTCPNCGKVWTEVPQ